MDRRIWRDDGKCCECGDECDAAKGMCEGCEAWFMAEDAAAEEDLLAVEAALDRHMAEVYG